MPKFRYFKFKNGWNELYHKEKLSFKEIGRRYNVDGKTVKGYIDNWNISKRCKFCGKIFYKKECWNVFDKKISCGSKRCMSKQRVDYARNNLQQYTKKYQKMYRKKNISKIREMSRRWTRKNPEKVRVSRKKYIQNNYERWRKSNNKNNKKQREKYRKIENKRRKTLGLPLVGEGFRKEMELFVYVTSLFPNYEIRRHDRTTLSWLELDIYIPELKLAFEYMGEQHYNEELFNKLFSTERTPHISVLQYRDRAKKRLCGLKGITLIKIRYDEKLSEQLVLEKLKKARIQTIQVMLDE